jgi:hypothetical protein
VRIGEAQPGIYTNIFWGDRANSIVGKGARSSFSEEKEAKRLCESGTRGGERRRAKRTKVFCFFFSKKKNFLTSD